MRFTALFLMLAMILTAHVSARQEFVELPGNPVIAPGFSGESDIAATFDPELIWDGELMRMYYTAVDAEGRSRIVLAVSSDLDHWESAGIVLDAGPSGAFDGEGVYGPSVIFEDGRTVMYYTGIQSGWESIGRIESADGIYFDRTTHPARQVLGASFNSGYFDLLGASRPSVILENGFYMMMYEGQDGTNWKRLGLAVSHDGDSFVRIRGNDGVGSVFGRGPHGFADGGALDPFFWRKNGDVRLLYTSLHY